jgi:hypothetical protein
MPDMYRDTDERYHNDPAFHAAVTSLEAAATKHGFTPGELKQIAFKAALNIEMRTLAVIGVRAQQGPVQTVTTPEEYEAAYGAPAPREPWDSPGVMFIHVDAPPGSESAATHVAIATASLFPSPVPMVLSEPLIQALSVASWHEPGSLAGHLKDGTPVYFGRTPCG